MYFVFPAEPSSSLSTLTSLMATAEDGGGWRERKVKERERCREAERQRQGERNKEEGNSGDKRRAMGERARETT